MSGHQDITRRSSKRPALLTTVDTQTNSNSKCHPYFRPTIDFLSRALAPLVSVTTALPAPDFPSTILAYHLLTSDQLDNLAQHYHQVWPPVSETFSYPLRIPAWVGTEQEVEVVTKRRRFGRFIGLQGCESPTDAIVVAGADDDDDERLVLEQMEREWQIALRRAREADSDAILRKAGGG
jgi:hypothetical protein